MMHVVIPPAARTLAVSCTVYGVVQALKKVPWLTAHITGRWAIALNVVLAILSIVVATPEQALYTTNTLFVILLAAGTAAGIHGTVRSEQGPQVLAATPPDGAVKEVPADLVPTDPANKPVKQ